MIEESILARFRDSEFQACVDCLIKAGKMTSPKPASTKACLAVNSLAKLPGGDLIIVFAPFRLLHLQKRANNVFA